MPSYTRLRFAKSRKPELLQQWLKLLGVRVQIYGAPVYDGKAWYLWFVPDDSGEDINSIDLDQIRSVK